MINRCGKIVNRKIIVAWLLFLMIFMSHCTKNPFYGLEPTPNDSDGPEIVVINPQPNQIVSGTLLIMGAASDKYSVASVSYQIDDAAPMAFSGKNTFNTEYDTTQLSQGTHTLTVKAVDDSGNSSTLIRSFVVDQNIPASTVSLNYENFENYVGGTDVLIQGTCADINGISKIQLSFDGGITFHDAQLSNGNTQWAYTISDTASIIPGDGLTTVVVRAIDNAGLIALVYFPLWVDNTAPSGSVLYPLNETNIDASEDLPGNILTVNGTCTDNTPQGIRNVGIEISGFSVDTVECVNGTFTLQKEVSGIVNDGPKTVVVTIRDKAGNTSNSQLLVSFNDEPPTFTGEISTVEKGVLDNDLSHAGSNFSGGSFTIQGTVDDPTGLNQIDKIELKIDSYPVSDPDADFILVNNELDGTLSDGTCNQTTGAWSHLFSSDGMTDGTYKLTFRVTDKLGGFQYVYKLIRIAKNSPVINLLSPLEGDLIGGMAVNLSGTILVPNSEIVSIRIQITDGVDSTEKVNQLFSAPSFSGLGYENGTFSWDWNTESPLFNLGGPHTIMVTVVDLAGNTGTKTVQVTKDPDAPNASFSTYDHPTNPDFVNQPLSFGRYLNGHGMIKGTASGTQVIQSVQIRVDGGSWNTVFSSILGDTPGTAINWQHTLNIDSNGAHTLDLKATDGNGISVVKSLQVIVDNDSPVVNSINLALTDNSATDYYHGIVNINGVSSDSGSGVLSVLLTLDADQNDGITDSLSSTGTTAFSASWNTQTLPTSNGTLPVIVKDAILVQARATDKAGNFAYYSAEGVNGKLVNVRPYLSSITKAGISKPYAFLGETGLTLTGHNFKTGAAVQIGGGVLSLADVTVNSVSSITINIPNRALNALEGLSSGAVIISSDGVSNSTQTPKKIDLFQLNTSYIIGASPLYPSAAADGTSIKVSFQSATNPKNLYYFNGTSSSSLSSNTSTGGGVSFTSTDFLSPSSGTPIQYSSGSIDKDGKYFRIYKGSGTPDFSSKTEITSASFQTATSHSLKIDHRDSTGNTVFLVYSMGGVLYSMKTTNGFSTIPTRYSIDANGGSWVSMALNPNTGIPHVVYFDDATDSLKYTYATKADGSEWAAPVVLKTMAGKYGNSIAVDSENRIHVSFYEMNSGDLNYATASSSSGAFSISIVDSAGLCGWFSSLTLDSSHRPHIVHYDFSADKIKYAFKAADGSWKTMFVVDTGLTLNSNSNTTAIVRTDADGSGTPELIHMVWGAGSNILKAVYLKNSAD